MPRKKTRYYHIDQTPQKKKASGPRRLIILLIAFVLAAAGIYLFILSQSTELPSGDPNSLKKQEDTLIGQQQDFVKIERLNLLVPFNAGDNAKVLDKGAWWRFPERGDPEKGGNFILAGHRFRLGATPNKTKEWSPFYHIEKLKVDDTIDVYFKGKWYSYKIMETKKVAPNAVEIEAPSSEAKMTLYSCSVKGSADGRVVLIAKPVAHNDTASSSDSGNPLL